MDNLNNGERQVAPEVSGIRRDHVARYEFAAKTIAEARVEAAPVAGSAEGISFTGAPAKVIDLACGIGYGASILADSGHQVTAIDRSLRSIDYGRQHYRRDTVSFVRGDENAVHGYMVDSFDWAVCFETVEHIEDPLPMLAGLRLAAKKLIASVPNEDVFPHGGRILHHFRHYTAAQFTELLERAGWEVLEWYGQEGPESEVEPGVNGRTLIAVCGRAPADGARSKMFTPATAGPVQEERDRRAVTILGLGASLDIYLDHVKRSGGRRSAGNEVWAINTLGDVFACDRVFHMDDIRVQEVRAAAAPKSNIAIMVEWLKDHPGPIYTSRAYPDYPGSVEFPLEAVINSGGYAYFNSTAAYAVALAVHEKVVGINDWEQINLFGIDFTYANSHHAEKGRGCVEFWLGVAHARGIRIGLPEKTTLLDMCEPDDAKLYGYGRFGSRDVKLTSEDGKAKVTFTERDALPTAAEIEAEYDHSKPTVSARALERG